MQGDTESSEFSVVIDMIANAPVSGQWQFGFYMPRSYRKLFNSLQNINPNLNMEICDVNGGCAALVYKVANSVTDSDWSQGCTTVLEPQSPFPLVSGRVYQIKLLHSNQWNVGNVSSYPQNLFFVNQGKIFNLKTEPGAYTLLGYDENAINLRNAEHVASNWQNSASLPQQETTIVPTPAQTTFSSGRFVLNKDTLIHNTMPGAASVATMMADDLLNDLNLSIAVDNNPLATMGIMIIGCGNSGFLSYLNHLTGIRYRGYPKGISLEVPAGVCQNQTPYF